MRVSTLACTVMAALGIVVASATVQAPGGANQTQGRADHALASLNDPTKSYVPQQLLVQFRRGATDNEKAQALGRVGAVFSERIVRGANRADSSGDLELVRLPQGQNIAAAVRELQSSNVVDFAEPNWIYRHTSSNDPYYGNGSLWGMYGDQSNPRNDFGSQAAEAWNAGNTNCSNVVVGVIDEGVMNNHADLRNNIWVNPNEIASNRLDDDGNGYVNDVYGWDFANNDNSVYDGTADDHGTHVAGTIGAAGNNSTGVAGVCWSVKIVTAKFLGQNGGTLANAIKSVDYMTALKQRGVNLVATNNSWGGGGYSKGLYDAIERANQAGILFIAAAGNSSVNNDTSPSYPSSYNNSNIIAVASITSTGALSSFSNYGATSVHLGAPGSNIWSTVPGRNNSSAYASYNGTSMATPHVTGAAALYKAKNPAANAAAIKGAILSGTIPTNSLSGKTTTGGRLSVSDMLTK
jgi:subtilisin family serine protease